MASPPTLADRARHEDQPATPGPWLAGTVAALALAWREWVRFVRQRNRVFGAIGQPVVFWLLFGAGLGPTFRLPGDPSGVVSYREYFFPGTLVLIVLFTAIFTTISLIEDRREGFWQSALVAPVPAWSLVMGKVLGGTLLATVQGLVFLLLGFTWQLEFSVVRLVAATALLMLTGWGLVALGFWLAWRINSSQGYHAVMSVLLLPMWLLSGAFFPVPDGLLRALAVVNPVSYAVAGLRRVLAPDLPPEVLATLPGWPAALAVLLGFALAGSAISTRAVARRGTGEQL